MPRLLLCLIALTSTAWATRWTPRASLENARHIATGGHGRFVVAYDGGIRHFDGSAWQTTPTDGGIHTFYVESPTRAWAYGRYQGIYHWDGTRWTREHHDPAIWSTRSYFDMYRCDGKLYATDNWSTKVREGKSWRSLGRIKRPCGDPRGQPLPSPARCWRHQHSPSSAVTWCANGLNVWDANERVWRTHPAAKAEVGLRNGYLTVPRWQGSAGGPIIAVGRMVYSWTKAGWVAFDAGASVDRIIGDLTPILVVGDTFWTPAP